MADYDAAFPPLVKPFCILIMGHSFIQRLAEYAEEKACPNMALDPSLYKLLYRGTSGLKLSGLITQWGSDAVREQRPDVVFVEIGTNDLATGIDPKKLAREVIRFASYLVKQCNVKKVVISQTVFRESNTLKTPIEFNEMVTRYNSALRQLAQGDTAISFWRHKNLWAHWRECLADGVHFNNIGNRRYYNSVRGGIIAAINAISKGQVSSHPGASLARQ